MIFGSYVFFYHWITEACHWFAYAWNSLSWDSITVRIMIFMFEYELLNHSFALRKQILWVSLIYLFTWKPRIYVIGIWSKNKKEYEAAIQCCCLCLIITKIWINIEVQCQTCAELLYFKDSPNQNIYLWFSQIYAIRI